jgi:hypothetical protein
VDLKIEIVHQLMQNLLAGMVLRVQIAVFLLDAILPPKLDIQNQQM